MTVPQCRDCRFHKYIPATGLHGDKQSLGICGKNGFTSAYERMQWWWDTDKQIPEDSNCGPEGRFFEERAI